MLWRKACFYLYLNWETKCKYFIFKSQKVCLQIPKGLREVGRGGGGDWGRGKWSWGKWGRGKELRGMRMLSQSSTASVSDGVVWRHALLGSWLAGLVLLHVGKATGAPAGHFVADLHLPGSFIAEHLKTHPFNSKWWDLNREEYQIIKHFRREETEQTRAHLFCCY